MKLMEAIMIFCDLLLNVAKPIFLKRIASSRDVAVLYFRQGIKALLDPGIKINTALIHQINNK